MSNVDDAVGRRLEADRKDLLDLSLRNPLLNYRARSRSLEVVGESPAEVYRRLVGEGRALSFLHDPAATDDEPPAPDRPDDPGPALSLPPASPTDLKLQTRLSADQLASRLLAIYYAARTTVEEQGVNTLYLALGMLAWSEEDAAKKVFRAPLVLVPVALERSSARERFRIRHDGEDLGVNLSLAEKLRAEFGIELPAWPESDDELDVAAYFDAVAAAVAERPGWGVDRDAIALGFFAFGKFLMYVDLDQGVWPEEATPAGHPVVRALLGEGFREPPPAIGDDEPLDRHLDPRDARQVVDADSSQLLALLDVDRGRNLVIQGPPGTGKSQTITNLIAGAVGRGKTVLFVAEKMAALEVVKRRLDAVGLGVACLELHSHKTRKKAVLDELRRTLELGRPKLGAVDDDLLLLAEVRDRLNAYHEAVNAPVDPSGVTPHEAIGEWLLLREGPPAAAPPRPDLPGSADWTGLEYRRRLDLVEQLRARLAAAGVPREHPFWGSRRTLLLPSDEDQVRVRIDAARRATDALREAAGRLGERLRLDPPAGLDGTAALVRAAHWVASAGRWRGVDVRSEEWTTRRGPIRELLDAGLALAHLRGRYDATLLPDAWDRDVASTREDLNTSGRSPWRFVSPTYRRARRTVASLCRGTPPRGLEAQLDLLDAVQEARRHRETLRRLDDLGARLFGDRWRGDGSDWPALDDVGTRLAQLHDHVQGSLVPPETIDRLADPPAPPEPEAPVAAVQGALSTHREALASLVGVLELDEGLRFGPGALGALGFEDQAGLFGLWGARVGELRALVAVNVAAGACRDAGLGEVVALAESWREAAQELGRAFRLARIEGLLGRAYRERSALSGFDPSGQERAVATFRELDRLALRHAQARLALDHWERLPRKEGGGQIAVLRREFEKKARHLPVRQLMARAGHAVRAIKPVFMMSPMSVASFLPPGLVEFDLVVFDEASQVRPVDALGALLRGRQAVVVGDSRQLPPTSFFDRLTGGGDDDSDEPDEASRDVESILGLFASQGAPQRLLRWHYRSRHESLIAVSNREFYDDRLVVFPSPDASRSESGLVLRHLPGAFYDRGKTRTNPDEADAVAAAVMAFAREQLARAADDRRTLGVAAFGMPQMQAILDRLERLRRADPACEPFFAERADEPFFVKNLENVQGDERDVIFISVGYGRTADGKVALNFGPLNQEGGERRLNVLITRARRRCEVFTSLTADDIDPARTDARGVRALRTFLAYAQAGPQATLGPSAEGPGSPFEEAVLSALQSAGLEARPRVGSAGSRIDVAVVDPARPGRYALGVASDGPGGPGVRSARDRERLRPQVLEGLGWRLRRAWCAGWIRDPEAELARLVAALDEARPSAPANRPPLEVAEVPRDDSAPGREGPEAAAAAEPAEVPAYQLAPLAIALGDVELHEVPVPRMASWIVEVVGKEGPVQTGEVARRIADAAGVKRVGRRIQETFDRALGRAIRQGTVRREGDFLWPAGLAAPVVRDRSGLPSSVRRLDLVAPEEIALAVERVVDDAYGMEPAAIPAAACRLLGFGRLSDEMRRRVEAIVDDLVARKRLVPSGEHLVIPDLKVAG